MIAVSDETEFKAGIQMPTVIVFHNGEPVERLVGLRSKDIYQKTIARYI